MTMPDERTRAVMQTKEFLQLLAAAGKSEVPENIQKEARRLLRHFPSSMDLEFAASACPEWWGPPKSRT